MTKPIPQIEAETTIRAKSSVLSTDVDGEVVLMEIDNGAYYALDTIASAVWEQLKDGIRFGELHRVLCTRFDGDAKTIEADLTTLIAYFSEIGVISIEQ